MNVDTNFVGPQWEFSGDGTEASGEMRLPDGVCKVVVDLTGLESSQISGRLKNVENRIRNHEDLELALHATLYKIRDKLSPIFHLREDEEELCNGAVQFLFSKEEGNEAKIAQNILQKIDADASSNRLSRLCFVLLRVEETNLDSSLLWRIVRACMDQISPGFNEKGIGEQIAVAQQTGEQAAFLKLLISKSTIYKEVLPRWSTFELNLQDSLELCMMIASKGESAAQFLAANIAKFGLESAKVEERLKLCKVIASQGNRAEQSLDTHFKNFIPLEEINKLPQVKDRLELCKTIVSEVEWARHFLAANFLQLGFLQDIDQLQSLEERIELCKMIASQGEWAKNSLIDNFQQLSFLQEINKFQHLEDRLELCKMIASQGEWAAESLVTHFAELRLESATIEDRLELCKIIASQGISAAQLVVVDFAKLGLESATIEDRLELFKTIALQGKWAAESLAKLFDKLGLERATVEDRLELCKIIASQGRWAAESLVTHFAQLGLESITVEDRLDLLKIIASQGDSVAESLVRHFNKLGLESAGINELLALCKTIALQGEKAAEILLARFTALGLESAGLEDRVELCKLIASQGEYAAKSLLAYFTKLRLKSATVEDRLELCKTIALQGKAAVEVLIQHLNQFGFQEEEEGVWISLAEYFAAIGCAMDFDKGMLFMGIQNQSIMWQMHLELWKPPSDFRGPSSIFRLAFTRELAPLLGVLYREEGNPLSTSIEDLKDFINEYEKLQWLLPFLEQIEKKEEHVQSILLNFMAYVTGVLYDLTGPQVVAIQKSGMVQVILEHENPLNRYRFMRLLSDVAKRNLDDLPAESGGKKEYRARLSHLLLSCLFPFKEDASLIEGIIKRIDTKAFRPISAFNPIIQFFLATIDQGPYSKISSIREGVAELIGQKRGKKSEPAKLMLSKINSLVTISKIFGRRQFINCLTGKHNSGELLRAHFQDLFGVGDVQQFGEKYQDTFGKFRDDVSLFTYARGLSSLTPDEQKRVRAALSAYVRAVLEKTFPDVRYDTKSSRHLEQVFSISNVQNKWREQQPSIQVSLASETEIGTSHYKEFFTQKILIDKHIDPGLIPRLALYLEGKGEEIIDSSEPLEQLQNLMILFLKGDIKDDEFITKVLGLGDSIPVVFQRDLEALKPKKAVGVYTIKESDDPCDLLLIGTEIKGSCQRVEGNPSLNKCLVSYLMNGEVRPIVIKQGDRLVARSVMRLMWDKTNQTPVILLERVYANVGNTEATQHILDWAKMKAESMGVPLVSKEVGKGLPFQGNVSHLGGFAPFVYSDASGGVLEGSFETAGCHALYQAPPPPSHA